MTAADKKKISQRSKKGDTLKWNAEKKSGWIYDGTWWHHYRDGKRTKREKEKHRISAKSAPHSVVSRAVGMVNPFHRGYEHYEKVKRLKAERKAKREQKEKLKLKKDKESVNEVLNQTSEESKKPVKKKRPSDQPWYMDDKTYKGIKKAEEWDKKRQKKKTTTETPKVKEKEKLKVKSSETKSKSTSKPKKRLTAREKMRAKNVERFGEAHVARLQAKHSDFKKMKKREMSKADFIKKYPKSQTAKRSRR